MNEKQTLAVVAQALTEGNGKIPQVSRMPRVVEIAATNIETNFDNTAHLLINTATKLEEKAAQLRERADYLIKERALAAELRNAVEYERASFEEAQALALVDCHELRLGG